MFAVTDGNFRESVTAAGAAGLAMKSKHGSSLKVGASGSRRFALNTHLKLRLRLVAGIVLGCCLSSNIDFILE